MSFRAESNQGAMSTLKLRSRPVLRLGALPPDEQAQAQVEMSRVQSEGGHPGKALRGPVLLGHPKRHRISME